MRLVLLGHTDLHERGQLLASTGAGGRSWTITSTSAKRRIGVSEDRGMRDPLDSRSQSGRR